MEIMFYFNRLSSGICAGVKKIDIDASFFRLREKQEGKGRCDLALFKSIGERRARRCGSVGRLVQLDIRLASINCLCV